MSVHVNACSYVRIVRCTHQKCRLPLATVEYAVWYASLCSKLVVSSINLKSRSIRVEKARSPFPLVRHSFRALRHSTSIPYSQTLKNQADHRIELGSSHVCSTIQSQSKYEHSFLLRPLHENRTPNRRRQCLAYHFVVPLGATQHCRSSEMCHRQQLVARVVVVEHSWVHRIGCSGGKWDVHPMREFASLRDGEEDFVRERCAGHFCNDVVDKP
jgi:hypothetical protein